MIVHPTPLKCDILPEAIHGSTMVGAIGEFMGGSQTTSQYDNTIREGDATSPSKSSKDLYINHLFYIFKFLLIHG